MLDSLELDKGMEDLYCTFQLEKVAKMMPIFFHSIFKRTTQRFKSFIPMRKKKNLENIRDVIIISPDYEIMPSMNMIQTHVDTEFLLRIKLWNKSKYIYSSRYIHPINASYHWLDKDRDYVIFNGLRTPLPRDAGPGEVIEFDMTIVWPKLPGTYWLQLSLIKDGMVWLHEMDDQLSIVLPAQVLGQGEGESS